MARRVYIVWHPRELSDASLQQLTLMRSSLAVHVTKRCRQRPIVRRVFRLFHFLFLIGRRVLCCCKCMVDDSLRLVQDSAQMIRSPKTLGINLVNVFRPGGARRKPSAFGDYLQPTDWRAVARRVSEDGLDFFACQFGEFHLLG